MEQGAALLGGLHGKGRILALEDYSDRESGPTRFVRIERSLMPKHPLDTLFAEIKSRKRSDPEKSYTAKLLQGFQM